MPAIAQRHRFYVIAAPGEISGSAVMLDSAYLIHSIFSHTGAQVYSTAILLMPPIAPRDPNSEALAYASLKELNHSIEKHTFTLHLPRQDKTFDFPAFNNGIFLVENRNERNLALKTQQEAIVLTSEWLFRTLLTPLKSEVDNFVTGFDLTASIQGKSAAYSSLGLATYILPVNDLITYSSTKLSAELLGSQVLVSELFQKVSQRLVDFFNRTNLRPDDLRERNLGSAGMVAPCSGMRASRRSSMG